MNTKVKQLIKQGEIYLALYKGYDGQGNIVHAFLVTNGENLGKLANSDEPVILGEYGQVLYSNEGYFVPAHIEDAVKSGFKKRYLKSSIQDKPDEL